MNEVNTIKACRECGSLFEPEREYYYLCPSCYGTAVHRTCEQTNQNGTKCRRQVTAIGKWKYCTLHENRRSKAARKIQWYPVEQPIALPAENWLEALLKL